MSAASAAAASHAVRHSNAGQNNHHNHDNAEKRPTINDHERSDADEIGSPRSPTQRRESRRESTWFLTKMDDIIKISKKQKTLPGQLRVKHLYETHYVQLAVAALIFGNFIVSACSAQILPEEGQLAFTVFYYLDWFFNGAFLIELFWNMYGNFFLSFWKSGWNVFDFFIVGVSITSLLFPQLPGVGVLRLFRAFRVFRLFKRVKSLRLIIVGVVMSLPGVMNAFVVLLLFMCIWAIMGVDFFGEDFEDMYGNFYVAVLTQFQIMTLDSWASGVARPIMENLGPFHAIFFISYVFINSIMMVNVVVAILLEKFVAAMNKFSDEEEGEKDDEGPQNTDTVALPEESDEIECVPMAIMESLTSMTNNSQELSRTLTLVVQERGLL